MRFFCQLDHVRDRQRFQVSAATAEAELRRVNDLKARTEVGKLERLEPLGTKLLIEGCLQERRGDIL